MHDSSHGLNPQAAPATVYSTAMVEDYAQKSNEYLKRRYKRRHEHPEKIRELMTESTAVVDNLRTAIEGKMDAAAIGVLQSILVAIEAGSGVSNPTTIYTNPKEKEKEYVEDAGDRQRALFKANICPIVVQALRDLGKSSLYLCSVRCI